MSTRTVYVPRLIESAEQAEALPKGSVVFDGDPEDGDTYAHVGGEWYTDGYPGLLSEALDLGFTVTALVPIEAEEEIKGAPDLPPPNRYARYATPWMETP